MPRPPTPAAPPAATDPERRVCEVAARCLYVDRDEVTPDARLVEDLNCDSLELLELFMALEDEFDITFPRDPPDPVYKSVFTRSPFRIRDLAEAVELRTGTGAPERGVGWPWKKKPTAPPPALSFTQRGGRWSGPKPDGPPLHEPLPAVADFPGGDAAQYRRRSDGMRCVLIPAATVEIGDDSPAARPDERPVHRVELDAFLIDAECVSTTAYCQFLNSVGETDPAVLRAWFLLDGDDHRLPHRMLARDDRGWHPVPGVERKPMVLVSWHGAHAYALWANDRDPGAWRDDGECFLPTEARWEYAARGPTVRPYPWGDAPPTADRAVFGRAAQARGADGPAAVPLADVHAALGMSPFGLHHAVGNVWQWCRDAYAPDFYSHPAATLPNPVNDVPAGNGRAVVRSERGGSWVGPPTLCRPSHRRGRGPHARGRCLGFRCVGPPPATPR